MPHSIGISIGIFVISLIAILYLAKLVAHHAEVLAAHFGEPYGTMILTISAVTIEVILIAIMMSGGNQPTLARDTIYSALMIDIAGILGIAALLGGIRHIEQAYNPAGTNTYIATIVVMLGVAMVLPDFIPENAQHSYGVFITLTSLLIYGVFLFSQTRRHKSYFQYTHEAQQEAGEDHGPTAHWKRSAWIMLLALVAIGVLSETLAHAVEPLIPHFGLPAALAGILVAVISASSELMTAIKAALRNNMQAAINIALGASVATLLLTIPAIELLSFFSGHKVELGLTPTQGAMLGMTLLTAIITLNDGETNILEGAVLLALFSGFAMLSMLIS